MLGIVTLLVVANQNEKNTKIDYIRSVGAIINESTKGLNEVQAVFSELEAISKGKKKGITPVPKLAIQLREAVNQRTALGRRSARLGAPSGLARRMRASLVYLFTLSSPTSTTSSAASRWPREPSRDPRRWPRA